jgi:hypothetical protein
MRTARRRTMSLAGTSTSNNTDAAFPSGQDRSPPHAAYRTELVLRFPEPILLLLSRKKSLIYPCEEKKLFYTFNIF